MSDITVEQFRQRFPEFDDIPDLRIQLALDDTTLYVTPTKFGEYFEQAYTHLAAALLSGMIKTGGRDGSGQGCDPGALPVTEQRAGDIILKTADPVPVAGSFFDSWLSLTVYGQRFLAARELATSSLTA